MGVATVSRALAEAVMANKREMMLAVSAVKAGLLTPEQVQECLDVQRREEAARGELFGLEAVIESKGYLTRVDIDRLKPPDLPKAVTRAYANQIPGFDVREKIGEGGVASVFRAYSDRQGADVALKVLFAIHSANETFVSRFQQEAQLLVDLSHPNLVKGHAHGSDPGTLEDGTSVTWHWMSMELIEGESALHDLTTFGAMDERKALHIVLQAAQALDYLRSRNCVHRDIKPENILFDPASGRSKLCDLGFAKEIEAGRSGEIETVTCGTVQYISPEQARGLADVDVRADIYSLGATLYHLVVGEVPFTGSDSMDIMSKQVLESLASEKYRRRGLSPSIGYFIEKMMAKEREVRYQSPAEMIEDMRAVMQGAADLEYVPDELPARRTTARISTKSGGHSRTTSMSLRAEREASKSKTVPRRRSRTGQVRAPDDLTRSETPRPKRLTRKFRRKR